MYSCKPRLAHNPTLHFEHKKMFFCTSGTHIIPNSLYFQGPMSIVFCFKSSWVADGNDLSWTLCHLRLTYPSSILYYNESLNCQHDNSEQVLKTKLFRMVRPRMRKNSFFIHLHVHLLIGYSSSYRQVSPHTTCVSQSCTIAVSRVFSHTP